MYLKSLSGLVHARLLSLSFSVLLYSGFNSSFIHKEIINRKPLGLFLAIFARLFLGILSHLHNHATSLLSILTTLTKAINMTPVVAYIQHM